MNKMIIMLMIINSESLRREDPSGLHGLLFLQRIFPPGGYLKADFLKKRKKNTKYFPATNFMGKKGCICFFPNIVKSNIGSISNQNFVKSGIFVNSCMFSQNSNFESIYMLLLIAHHIS